MIPASVPEREAKYPGLPRRAVAVRQEVDGDAAPDVGDPIDDVPPKVAILKDAVDKQSHRPAAAIGICYLAERGLRVFFRLCC
jgi:hypothetical protein